MKQQLREKVFSNLHISNEKALDELAYLMANNKLAEFTSEVEANIVMIVPFTSNLHALRFPHTINVHPTEKNGLL